MQKEQKSPHIQGKEDTRKQWIAPNIVELAMKETASGTTGASDGLDPGS